MLRSRLIIFGLWLTAWLPRPVAHGLGVIVGEAGFAFNRSARRTTIANLRVVFGPSVSRAELVRVARGCFRSTAHYYGDLARVPAMSPRRLFTHDLCIVGLEHLTDAVRRGKGVVGVSMHFGNPEYVAQCVSALDIHLVAVVEPLYPPHLSETVRAYRQSQGHEFVDAGVPGTKRVLRHLRAGGMIALLTDRDIQGNGEWVPFCGRPARLPTGAVELAMHADAALLPFITYRVGPGRFRTVIGAPLPLQRSGHKRDDVRANLAALVRWFEPHLRTDPSQWFVISQPVWAGRCAATSSSGQSRPPVRRRA